jgi:4-hydroxy-4-methyl-2-oxoglutarate aldolase
LLDEIVKKFKKISAADVTDVLKAMGYRNQVLNPGIRPVIQGLKLCGRAHTHSNLPFRKHETSVIRESEENFKKGEVVVEGHWGAWGYNFSMSAQSKGCVGVVVDGSCRDLADHRKFNPKFPVFCRQGLSFERPERSTNPGGSHIGWHTRYTNAYNVPVNCGGVLVNPGDIVLGDDDGIVIVPKEVEKEALKFAIEYEKLDHGVSEAFKAGMSVRESHGVKDDWQKKIGITDWLKSKE